MVIKFPRRICFDAKMGAFEPLSQQGHERYKLNIFTDEPQKNNFFTKQIQN